MIIIIVNSLRSQSNISSPLMLANWAATFASFYVSPLYSSSNILRRLQYRVLPYLFISLTTRKHLPLKHCPDFSLPKHAHFFAKFGDRYSLAVNKSHSLPRMLIQWRVLSSCTSASPCTIEHSDNNSFGFRDQKKVLLEVLICVPLNLQLGQRITLFLASTLQSARHGRSYKDYKTPANIYTYMQKKKKNLHGKVVIPSE